MKPIYYEDGALKMLDQTLLPTEEVIHSYTNYRDITDAIADMIVRGAPAIGVSAAYGVYFGAEELKTMPIERFLPEMDAVCIHIKGARPTAVNLFWAVNRMKAVIDANTEETPEAIAELLKEEAHNICNEDIRMCRSIGAHGAALINQNDTILTHCNAGALATADYGTALGVVRAAWEAGKEISVYADETRPFLQGARLTAYELHADGIPVTVITDNVAGWMMKQGKVNCVVVGADRIARNGDVANKIGTYSVAILAKAHGIPFYVAAPTSTIDFDMFSGEGIEIEERNGREVTHIKDIPISPEGVPVENPAFDVTPNENITAIITEKGVVYPPYDLSIPKLED